VFLSLDSRLSRLFCRRWPHHMTWYLCECCRLSEWVCVCVCVCVACTDIDECDMFNNLCINGDCENVMGYFQCTCAPGYRLDATGGNCTGWYAVCLTVPIIWHIHCRLSVCLSVCQCQYTHSLRKLFYIIAAYQQLMYSNCGLSSVNRVSLLRN